MSQSMIRINTKLDASGFSAGADKIKKKIEELKSGIERIGNASAVSDGMRKQTLEMEKNLSIQEKAVEKTKSKIAEVCRIGRSKSCKRKQYRKRREK